MLAQAERALGTLEGVGWALPNPRLLIAPFIRREAVLSSRIEGTRASLADVYAYEAGQLSLFEHLDDVREVLNYAAALEYGLARLETLPLSLRLVREIHAQLMRGVRGGHVAPGEFRHTQNWIGPPGSTLNDAPYVPPPVPEMHQALGDLERYLYADDAFPPLIRLGLIHYQFEAIHPFVDGNGRMGRLLVVLLLCHWRLLPAPLLYLSAYFESERDRYYDLLLEVSQRGSWEKWLIFFLRGVALQASDATSRALNLQALRERYRTRLQQGGAAGRLLQVVDMMFAQPFVSIPEIAAKLHVSYPTAQRYVQQIVGFGLLREVTGKARNRLYRADEILEAIERPLDPSHSAVTK